MQVVTDRIKRGKTSREASYLQLHACFEQTLAHACAVAFELQLGTCAAEQGVSTTGCWGGRHKHCKLVQTLPLLSILVTLLPRHTRRAKMQPSLHTSPAVALLDSPQSLLWRYNQDKV